MCLCRNQKACVFAIFSGMSILNKYQLSLFDPRDKIERQLTDDGPVYHALSLSVHLSRAKLITRFDDRLVKVVGLISWKTLCDCDIVRTY